MEDDKVPETVVPTNSALEDEPVKSRAAAEDEETFARCAEYAMNIAAAYGGESEKRLENFDATLMEQCGREDLDLRRRFVLVAYPKLEGSKWRFRRSGTWLNFFSTDKDGYRYIASIY